MTEQPDPTRELDLSELSDELAQGKAPHTEDVVEGEPGWDGDGAGSSQPEAD